MKNYKVNIIVTICLVLVLTVSVMAAVMTESFVLNPSADPVAFIAAHKGGGTPNYITDTKVNEILSDSSASSNVGPDGYEYIDEYNGGLFSIDSRLKSLVPADDYYKYVNDTFAGSFDFNQRSFCRYFGITEDQYKEAMSVFNRYEIYGDSGTYMSTKYPIGVFGDYDDFIEIFVREEYRSKYLTEECIPGDSCVHTFTYHTISDEMINCVGADKYEEFKEKYYGTEEFNILNFIEYFSLTKEMVEDALEPSAGTIQAYKLDYLFGTEDMRKEYFIIKSAQ